MSRLFLLRHAKAGWAEPGMRDFDRPLEPLGRTDADAIGAAMRASVLYPGPGPLLVRQAGARNVRLGRSAYRQRRVVYSDSLYSTDAAGYVDFIRADGRGRRRCCWSATIR